MHECDDFIAYSMERVEPKQAIQAMADFLTSRKMYNLSPLIPLTNKSEAAVLAQATKSPEVVAFLEDALRTRGERSMIYGCHCTCTPF